MPFTPDNQSGFKPDNAGFVPDANKNSLENALENPATKEQATATVASRIKSIANAFGMVMDPASNFLYGSTSRTVGGAIVEGIKGVQELTTGKSNIPEQKAPSYGDIAFTALELYPGGGFVSNALRKVKGGEKILSYISKLPENAKKKAIEKYSSIFKATSKESRALLEKTAGGLVERGQLVGSVGGLAEKAEGLSTLYGKKIDDYFKKLPADAKEQTRPIIDKLVELGNKYIVDGVVQNKPAVEAIKSTMENITKLGNEVSSGAFRKLRQIWDEHYDVTKQSVDDISAYTKKAQMAGADAIREEFAKTRPDLDKINKEFNFWSNVQKLGEYTASKSKGVLSAGIGATVGGIMGAESGQGVFNKIGGAGVGIVVGSFLGKNAIEFMKSPAWKSASSVAKYKLADAIMKNPAEAKQIISRMMAGVYNETK